MTQILYEIRKSNSKIQFTRSAIKTFTLNPLGQFFIPSNTPPNLPIFSTNSLVTLYTRSKNKGEKGKIHS